MYDILKMRQMFSTEFATRKVHALLNRWHSMLVERSCVLQWRTILLSLPTRTPPSTISFNVSKQLLLNKISKIWTFLNGQTAGSQRRVPIRSKQILVELIMKLAKVLSRSSKVTRTLGTRYTTHRLSNFGSSIKKTMAPLRKLRSNICSKQRLRP